MGSTHPSSSSSPRHLMKKGDRPESVKLHVTIPTYLITREVTQICNVLGRGMQMLTCSEDDYLELPTARRCQQLFQGRTGWLGSDLQRLMF